MSLFIVVTTDRDTNVLLESIIPERFPNGHYKIGKGQWLISFEGTARGLFEENLEKDDENMLGGCAVFRVTSYWGRHTEDMWEWIGAMKAGGGRD